MPTEEVEGGAETFTREYVEELRKEAAERRTSLKPYKEAFSSFNEEEQAFLLELVNELGTNQGSAGVRMRDLSYQLLGEDAFLADAPWSVDNTGGIVTEEETPPAEPAPAGAGAPLVTLDDLQRVLDERDAKAANESQAARQAQEVDNLIAEAKGLGFEPGTPDYAMLMWYAANDTDNPDGDLSVASEKAKAYAPAAPAPPEAGDESPAFPATASAGGAGAQPEPPTEPPKTMQEAKDRMKARIERMGSEPG